MPIIHSDPKIEISRQASGLIKSLLSDKHLYQSAALDLAFLDQLAGNMHAEEDAGLSAMASAIMIGSGGGPRQRAKSKELYRKDLDHNLAIPWSFTRQGATTAPKPNVTDPIFIQLPTVNTVCSNRGCGGKWPCNPLEAVVRTFSEHSRSFYLPYQCQNCKGAPVNFLVKRFREKLVLCGRDPIEEPSIADHLPKEKNISKHYRNATIAFNAGQTLAGICLLRIFVEQFWRSIPAVAEIVKANTRPTGDELGEAYKTTLPDDFKQRFPTLLEAYGSLSQAIHGAKDESAIFEENRGRIIEHFEARRLFKLV